MSISTPAISQNKTNKKAIELCRCIEELKEPFQTHLFRYNEYGEDDNKKIRLVKKFLGLKQTRDLIVLCYFIDNGLSNRSSLSRSQIFRHFKQNLEGCLQLNHSLEYLLKRNIIQKSRSFGNSADDYSLAPHCLTAIFKYQKGAFHEPKDDSFESFTRDLDNVVENTDEVDGDCQNIIELINQYAQTKEIQWLREQRISPTDEAILCLAVRSYILNKRTFNLEEALIAAANSSFERFNIKKAFESGQHRLLTDGFLKYKNAHFRNLNSLTVSDKTIAGMCLSMPRAEKEIFVPKLFTLLQLEDSSVPYLHHSEDLQLIEKMVSLENYEKIRSKVPRLSILLTGEPGVGKTSFINHLAKISGRNILSAKISDILGCYVGESEKNLVNLFREAEMAYEQCEVTPIIVFDEAESLLFKRNVKAGSSAAQMNNNVISLLLSSLDKFKGILICCTNFNFKNGNFDPALHRRFHIVSEVTSPPKDILKSIFHNHFPECSEEQCGAFMDRYPQITPAQIRNIKEKYEVVAMLEDIENPVDVIYRIAEQNLGLFTISQRRKVGF